MQQKAKVGGLKPLNFKEALGFEEETADRLCPEHGPYIAKIRKLADGKGGYRVVHESMCPTCFGLQKQAEEAETARKEIEAQAALERQRIESCLDAMCVPPRYRGMTFDSFETIGDQADSKARKKLVAQSYVEKFSELAPRGIGMVFLGGSGTGKTHLACAVLQALMSKVTGLYITCDEMLDRINSTYCKQSQTSTAEIKNLFSTVPLLVLDEIGRTKLTPAAQSTIFKIVDARYSRMLPTIFVSNALEPKQFVEQITPAAWDRIQEVSKLVTFTWKSMRTAPEF